MAAPRNLSSAEFLRLQDKGKVRGDWTYKMYVDWVSKTRKNRAARRAAANQVPYSGYMNADQIREYAKQQAGALTAADVAALNSMRPGILREGANFAQQENLAAGGLAGVLQPIAGQVSDIWNNAANQSASFAQGFSDALRGMIGQEAQGSNELASHFGQAGVEDVSQQAGDALYGAGGYVPARSLAASGAGFASAAAMLPATARLQGGLLASQRRADTQEELARLADKIAEAKAGRGKYFLQSLQDQRSYQNTLFDNALRARAQSLYEQNMNFDNTVSGAGVYTDPTTGKPVRAGYAYNPTTGRVERIPTPPKPVAAGAEKKEAASNREKAFSQARKEIFDDAAQLKSGGRYDFNAPQIDYATARTNLFNKHMGLLRFASKNGKKALRIRLLKIIDEALAAAGIVKPGGGKPYVPRLGD